MEFKTKDNINDFCAKYLPNFKMSTDWTKKKMMKRFNKEISFRGINAEDLIKEKVGEVKTKPVELKPLGGKYANKDINLTYRQGDLVPQSQIEQWKLQGINYTVWFD